MINIQRDIYPIIAKDTTLCINGIWPRDTDWFEVSLGISNITVFYRIVNETILESIVD